MPKNHYENPSSMKLSSIGQTYFLILAISTPLVIAKDKPGQNTTCKSGYVAKSAYDGDKKSTNLFCCPEDSADAVSWVSMAGTLCCNYPDSNGEMDCNSVGEKEKSADVITCPTGYNETY